MRPLGRWTAVEADRAREAVSGGGLQPAVAAAEAEADGEDGALSVVRAQHGDRGGRVGGDAFGRRRADMRPEVELGVAFAVARRAAEVVDRDGVDADLGEADGKLFVKAEEAAHIGQDHHPGAVRRFGLGVEGGELDAVGGGERQIFNIDRRPGDRCNRGQRFKSVAHRLVPLRRG